MILKISGSTPSANNGAPIRFSVSRPAVIALIAGQVFGWGAVIHHHFKTAHRVNSTPADSGRLRQVRSDDPSDLDRVRDSGTGE